MRIRAFVFIYLKKGINNNAADRTIKIAIALQPMILLKGLLTYLPMIFLLFTSNIIQMSTTGNKRPFITCDHKEMKIKGAFGNKIMRAPTIKMPVYKM